MGNVVAEILLNRDQLRGPVGPLRRTVIANRIGGLGRERSHHYLTRYQEGRGRAAKSKSLVSNFL